MSKLLRPVLFSAQFRVPPGILDDRNLLDPILNADTKVFIDPLLLRSSSSRILARDGLSLLQARFGNVLRLVRVSQNKGDVAWRAAINQLGLEERKETCLGFGGSSVSGSSRPEAIKEKILTTAKEILNLGVSDPEIISLMGFLEEGIGPDTISDLTTNAIVPALAQITKEVCEHCRIRTHTYSIDGKEYQLPRNPYAKRDHGVLLVPRDILRDLPIAVDLTDVSRVAFENRQIRIRVNELLADFAKATVAEKKAALRKAALQSAQTFLDLFESLIRVDRAYDPVADPDGIYAFRHALRTVAGQNPRQIAQLRSKSEAEVIRIVNEIIDQFKNLIERNDLAQLLWYGDVPRKEKAAQLLFFAVAEAYCHANNLDISPETHSGGGPVDFKFSSGHNARYVVELKLSTGSVEHGYSKQLDVYREASGNCQGALIVIKVGSQEQLDRKLKRIVSEKELRERRGEKASAIHVIDGTLKPSASRRP